MLPIYISHSNTEGIGKEYSMSCTSGTVETILIPYFVIELSATQIHDRISMTNTNDTLQLFIPSLNTSDAALYTCTALVKAPGTGLSLRNSSNFTLTLKSESFFMTDFYSLPPSTNS